jgi:(p)ppGpp synthase/HD superfamily hydrolase
MHNYAQTNVQLLNQLRSEGYSKNEREHALTTYELAMRLFTGLFLPSGKPFIDHLVGTASILASLRVPIEIVSAGLIHAAYLHGDFGDATDGITDAKRRRIREEVGAEIEDYVARYERLVWSPDRIPIVRDRLDELGPVERNVVLMRLANELEHHLDLAALYFPDVRVQKGHQKFLERYGPIVVQLAERLGAVSLSAELAAAFREIASAQLPLEPRVRTKEHAAYLVVARSYRVRLRVRTARQAYRLFARLLQSARRRYWKIPEPISGWLRIAVRLSGIKVK